VNLDDAEFLLSATDVWWGGDVPMLTPEQHSELKGLVHDPILPGKDAWFQHRLDAIFRQAVRSETLFQRVRKGVIVRPGPDKGSKRHPKKLSTVVRRELKQISKSAESLAAVLEDANDVRPFNVTMPFLHSLDPTRTWR